MCVVKRFRRVYNVIASKSHRMFPHQHVSTIYLTTLLCRTNNRARGQFAHDNLLWSTLGSAQNKHHESTCVCNVRNEQHDEVPLQEFRSPKFRNSLIPTPSASISSACLIGSAPLCWGSPFPLSLFSMVSARRGKSSQFSPVQPCQLLLGFTSQRGFVVRDEMEVCAY